MIKLNCGCAVVRLEGYINIDNYVDCDLKHDLTTPLPYEDESVDEILASHILEHFNYNELKLVLRDWNRVLKMGGILHIRVPDLIYYCKGVIQADKEDYFQEHLKRNEFTDGLYGGHWNQGEIHKNGFTKKRLIAQLIKYGFTIDEILKSRTIREKPANEINIKFRKIKTL